MTSHLLVEIESLLVELRDTLGSLIDCLKHEREAVIEYDLKVLAETQREKNRLLSKVKTLEYGRQNLMLGLRKAYNLTEESNVDYLLAQVGDQQVAERIRHHLSCVKSLAQAAQEFNESQRQFLAHSLASVQASLALLDSLQGNGVYPASYNAKGKLSAGAASTIGTNV